MTLNERAERIAEIVGRWDWPWIEKQDCIVAEIKAAIEESKCGGCGEPHDIK